MRKEVIGDCMLFLGDCREVIASFPECFRVGAVVTDPPYGVGMEYKSTDDTPEFVRSVAVPVIEMCRSIADRVVLTPGIKNLFAYPPPTHTGAIYYPAGAGMNVWGFTCWQPILYYGKDPYLAHGKGSKPDSFSATDAASKADHPCPKPIGQMRRIVDRVTFEKETVLDPFMGSGTTGVACINLGRKFIGIEIDEGYFDIACRRIDAAYSQPDFLIQVEPDPTQQDDIFS